MKKVNVKTLYAFSIKGSGGNPAGVVLNADTFSNKEKQNIAAKTGLSETAFVSKSEKAQFKLEFFTPLRQIAHCGHATIATFTYLKQMNLISGDRSSKETADGTREIYFENDLAFMEQNAPVYTSVENDLDEILSSVNLSKSDLAEGQAPEIINTGNSFLIIPVRNVDVLKKITPDLEQIRNYSEKRDLIGFYPFSALTGNVAVATARMFGPRFGIAEESGTGMAAGPLACYLHRNNPGLSTKLILKQGEFMPKPSPSLIRVNLVIENNAIKKLYAGGDAYAAEERFIEF